MPAKKWTLTDAIDGVYVNQQTLAADALGLEPGCEITKWTLRGGLSDGVDVVRVSNGRLTFDVLPTRGMGVWKLWCDGIEIGWQSPNCGPVHPSFVPLMEPGGLGWLDGFDELLVRCGLESNGAPEFDSRGQLVYPLHGRVANRPARRVEVEVDRDTGVLSVVGIVEETRFHFTKLRMTSRISTRVGEASVTITDEIENFSGRPGEAQMLYHINFGQPLLDPGSRFVAPVKKVVPRDARAAQGLGTWNVYAAGQAGYSEEVYFLELLAGPDGGTRTLLKNAAGDRGVSVLVNTRELPCYTLWKNTVPDADGYVTGLEPGTNFPNVRTHEGRQGRVLRLAPGGRVSLTVGLEVHSSAEAVTVAEQAVAALQAGTSPRVFAEPQPGWCMV